MCDYYWDHYDSNTVCWQLGYSGAVKHYRYPFVGDDSAPVWMEDVGCVNYEACLGKCSFKGFGKTSCQHSQDMFVSCKGTRDSNKLGNK